MPSTSVGYKPTPTHEILKSKRLGAFISLRTLAAELGCSHVYLYDLENGRRALSKEFARRWRRTLNNLR